MNILLPLQSSDAQTINLCIAMQRAWNDMRQMYNYNQRAWNDMRQMYNYNKKTCNDIKENKNSLIGEQ